MIKSILKVIIPLVSFFAITEAYAQDIRYVYCTAELIQQEYAESLKWKRLRNLLFFLQYSRLISILSLCMPQEERSQPVSSYLLYIKMQKMEKAHPYLTTDHTGRLEGCTRDI